MRLLVTLKIIIQHIVIFLELSAFEKRLKSLKVTEIFK